MLAQVLGGLPFLEAIEAGEIEIDGDAGALLQIFGNLDTFGSNFPIVTP